jgi:hypothetical protein
MATSNLKVNIVAVDKASKNLDKVGDSFASVGNIAAGVAAAGIAVFAKQAITAASDLEETQSKVGVIFGDSAGKVEEFGDQAAKSIGQSKTVAMSAAATFATFGKSAGLTGDELAGFSTEFTTLASDLASFNNTSPEQAIEAIGAALRGEAEPIRAYGVLLDDATLKQEAMALGLIKTTKDALTPQNKVLAAQAAIYKQTTDAQGDFARTADGLANSQRTLSAEWQDAQAQLGQFLLPYAKTAVGTFTDLLGVFTEMEPATQKTVVQVVALGGAAVVAGPRIADMAQDMVGFIKDLDKGQARFAATATALAAIGAAAIATSNSAAEMRSELDEAIEGFASSGSRQALGDTVEKFNELRQKQEDLNNGSGVWDTLSDGAESFGFRFTNGFKHIDDQVTEYQRQIEETGRKTDSVFELTASRLGITTREAERLAETTGIDLSQGVGRASDGLVEFYNSNVKAKDGTEKTAQAQDVLNDSMATAEDKVKAFRAQLDQLGGGYLTVDAAQDRFQASVDSFTESVKDNGRTLDGNTEKGRANKDALRGIAESARDAAVAAFEVSGSQKDANVQLSKGRDAFIRAARAAGLTGDKAQRLADKYGLIPKVVPTKAKFDDKEARRKIASFSAWASSNLPNVVINPNARTEQQEFGARIPGRASGGPVRAGQAYIVGEKRAELFVPDRSGTIIPRIGVSSGGGPTVVVNVSGVIGSKDDVARWVEDAVGRAIRRGSIRMA